MAGSSFKQECPSCEAQVPIKDVSFVGKKVACPKCKYPFVVQKPKGDTVTDDNGAAEKKPAKGKGAPAPVAEPAPAAPSKSASRKKMIAGLGLAGVGLVILVLASFFIMGRGGGSKVKKMPSGAPPVVAKIPDPETPPGPEKKPEDGKTETPGDEKDKTPKEIKVVIDDRTPLPPGPDLTNLLPPNAEHVFHGFFKDLFDFASPFRSPVFDENGTFLDVLSRERLGFAPSAIDDLIRADRFTDPAWSYTVLHFKEFLDEKAWIKALALKAQAPVNKLTYYQATKRNAWFDQLGRTGVGVPHPPRGAKPAADRLPCVFFYDGQTAIVGDEKPIRDFLEAGKRFRPQGNEAAPPAAVVRNVNLADTIWEGKETRPGGQAVSLKLSFASAEEVVLETPSGSSNGTCQLKGNELTLTFSNDLTYTGKVAGSTYSGEGKLDKSTWKFTAKRVKGPGGVAKGDGKSSQPEVRSGTYMTLPPALKGMLDRMEARDPEGEEIVLFSTATQADAARRTDLPADSKDQFVLQPRQVWDLAALLEDRRPPRLTMLGSGLILKESQKYLYRAELECAQEKDASDLHKMANDQFAPTIALWFERMIQHKISTPQLEAMMDEGVEKKEMSRWTAELRDQSVDVTLNLIFDNPAMRRVQGVAGFLALSQRGAADLGMVPDLRHRLARAGKELGEQGSSSRGVPPGSYPPAAFKPSGNTARATGSPYYRMSWMTALLPYLGHDNLTRRLAVDASWRDPANWLAARTVVPEFQDPTYPDAARFVNVSGLGVDLAATHVVGIAGVGLDAGEYGRDDPAMVARRGVLSYEKSATIAEIQKGHGLSQTILTVQVPHDGLTGVSPWIAGGGSTLRGVPDKNSIAPFVLTTDRDGKPITYQGRQGTFATMTDASVRFIDKNVSDAVFKAMCTVQGPIPADANLFGDAPLVADPTAPPTKPAAKPAAAKAAAAKTAAPSTNTDAKAELAPSPMKVEAADDKKKD